MNEIGRRDLVLLVIGLDKTGGVGADLGGVTRLQKFLYLLQREEDVLPSGEGFEFTAYKAGPYSSRLYDDIEFLENLGLIESEVAAEATEPEAAEADLTFEELIDDDEDEEPPRASEGPADRYEERRFRLTAKGRERVQQLLEKKSGSAAAQAVRRIKSRYGSYSLTDLLRYVYTKYPEMAVESEIKEHVLGRNRR